MSGPNIGGSHSPKPWDYTYTGPRCGAPPNADTHLPTCEKPAGHEGYHGAVGYAWGEHPVLGMLLPMPEAWAPREKDEDFDGAQGVGEGEI